MNIHPAFGGHGVSGVLMGPDGRLYWEVGDIGLHVTDRGGKIWSYPNQGAVMRSDPDGSNFEVFATGIRNLQEFSFDEHGNLISVDNDGDYPSEAERVVYLPWGSETGWRSTWQYGKYTDPKNNRYNVWIDEQVFKPRFEGRTARVLAPIANWHAGPSGMAYNPGTALSDAWKNHFFVTSFVGSASTARVYAFKLEEKGAGFAMGPEQTLLKGILAVGLRIGPDGALYVTDWITGWDSKNKGRIWKLDTPETANSALRKDVRTLLGDDFAKGATPEIAQLLSHADMRVRQKAQFDLVRRGESAALLAAARNKTGGLARLHGLWGLAQLARKDASKGAVFAEFLTDQDGEIRAQAARMIGDVKIAALAPKVLPLLMDTAPRARYFAAEAIARTVYKPGGAAIVDMLADNDGHDLYIQHVGAIALAAIGDAKALEALSTHAKPAVRSAAVVALGRMKHAGVARFLKDADAAIATDAARAINDDGSIVGAVPALAATLTDTTLTGEPYLRRALNANLRVGSREAVDRVAAFAADVKRPEPLRVEAVSILGVWAAPSPLDRVDGFYLTPFAVQPASTTPRDGAAARAAIERMLASMPADATEKVKVALAEAAGRSGAAGAAPALLAMLKNDASQTGPAGRARGAAPEQGRQPRRADADRVRRQVPGGAARGHRHPADAADLGRGQDAAAGDALRERVDGGEAGRPRGARQPEVARVAPGAAGLRRPAQRRHAAGRAAGRSARGRPGRRLGGAGQGPRDVSHREEGRHAGAGLRRGAQQGRRLPQRPARGHRQPGGGVHAVPHHPRPRQRRRAGSVAHRIDADPAAAGRIAAGPERAHRARLRRRVASP